MKILFINGSPRKTGYTSEVLRYIEKGISTEHDIEWVHAYDISVSPCKSCMLCRPDKDCALPTDDGHRVSHLIRNADALVIGSPTYFGNISGPLKTLIDRSLTGFEEIAANGLEMPLPLHKGKKSAMVTACNMPGPASMLLNHAGGTLLVMETILKAGGYDIAGSIVLEGAAAKKHIPEEIKEKALLLGKELCR